MSALLSVTVGVAAAASAMAAAAGLATLLALLAMIRAARNALLDLVARGCLVLFAARYLFMARLWRLGK